MSYKLNACRKLMAGAAFISLSLPFATLSLNSNIKRSTRGFQRP